MLLLSIWFISSFVMHWLAMNTYESYEFWRDAELIYQFTWIVLGLFTSAWFVVLAAAYVALVSVYDVRR